MEVSNELLVSAGCSPKLSPFLLPYFKDTCLKYSINTASRFLCFLAQLSHESGGFFYTEELASGEAYEGRKDLGNTQHGDGVKFKGRGTIQITGRANYKSLSDEFGVDFISHPELLGGKNMNMSTAEQQKWSIMSAGWFWSKTKLNVYADKVNINISVLTEPNLSSFVTITKRINGGINGLDDRRARFEKIRTYINSHIIEI